MSDDITFESTWVGNRVEFAARNGSLRFADRVDPASQRSRKSLAKAVAERFPNVDIGDIDTHLLEMLDKREQSKASEPDELGDPNDASDAALAQMPQSVRDEALAMLKAPDLIEQVAIDIAACGIVGENHLALSLYTLATSRLLDKPLAGIVQGSSSSGKSHAIERVGSLFPSETKVLATDISQQALFYMEEGSLRHRVVFAGERSRKEDDDTAEKTKALREMISAGELRKQVTAKNSDGELATREVYQPGPIAYVESTTLGELFDEDRNRCLLLASDDSEPQTRRILTATATAYVNGPSPDSKRIIERHHAAQRLLRRVSVRVPFAERIAAEMPSDKPEARRAFHHAMGVVQAVGLLHQFSRCKKPEHGVTIEATIDDYAIARELLAAPLGRSLGGALPDHVIAFGEWVGGATVANETFVVDDLLAKDGCRWAKPTAYRHVAALRGVGFLVVASKDQNTNRYRVAGPLPRDGALWLPRPEALV